jgi:hypothetical protein
METLLAALLPGVALGGVLAVAGAWSRLARGAELPHLGVGALAGALALVAARLAAPPTSPRPVTVLVVAVAGAGLAALLALLDRRVRAVAGSGSGRPGGPPLVADVAVLAAVVGAVALVRPAIAVPLPFGPLGGQPGAPAAIAAALLGVGGAVLLGTAAVRRIRPVLRWAVAGALLGLVVVPAAGTLTPAALAFGGIIGLPDTAGLALRAAAVGLAARRDAADAVAAGFGLGLAESALAALIPLGGAALVPTVVALAVGLVIHVRDRGAAVAA